MNPSAMQSSQPLFGNYHKIVVRDVVMQVTFWQKKDFVVVCRLLFNFFGNWKKIEQLFFKPKIWIYKILKINNELNETLNELYECIFFVSISFSVEYFPYEW